MENCFPTFYSEVVSAFVTEVRFLYAAKCWVLGSVYISSLLFYVFLGEFSPLMLRDIKEKGFLLPVIFVFRDGIMFVWLSSFGLVERLLSCFFSSLVSLIVLKCSFYYPLKGWINGKILCKFGFCHGISCFLCLWYLRVLMGIVAWAGICILLGSV